MPKNNYIQNVVIDGEQDENLRSARDAITHRMAVLAHRRLLPETCWSSPSDNCYIIYVILGEPFPQGYIDVCTFNSATQQSELGPTSMDTLFDATPLPHEYIKENHPKLWNDPEAFDLRNRTT